MQTKREIFTSPKLQQTRRLEPHKCFHPEIKTNLQNEKMEKYLNNRK